MTHSVMQTQHDNVIMPNVEGPSQRIRTFISSVMCKVQQPYVRNHCVGRRWVEEVKNRTILNRTQRLAALQITRCYRMISDTASLILAGTPSVELTASERERVAARLATAEDSPGSILDGKEAGKVNYYFSIARDLGKR